MLKNIADKIINYKENLTNYETKEQWYLFVLDIIDTKIYKIPPKQLPKVIPKNISVVFFTNKGMDDINLSKIFQNPEITSSLPETLQNSENLPCVTYKLSELIRSKILTTKKL